MIAILGAGAFGSALAIALGQKHDVTLWARAGAETLQAGRRIARLPDATLPPSVKATGEIAECREAQIVLLALPMQALAGFLVQYGPSLPDVPHVACCKGLDLETGLGPTAIIHKHLGTEDAAILTGPSFAADIARGLPTALTLAAQSDTLAQDVQAQLSTTTLRLYSSTDTKGAELGGALKNVIAIGCGVVMGAGLGESARAALMTRGFSEMQRLAAHLGGHTETLNGLSGLGDLALTCMSSQSRNFRFGAALGAGRTLDPRMTVEGKATAQAVQRIARADGLDLPVCDTIAKLAAGRITVQDATAHLMARPLKQEM